MRDQAYQIRVLLLLDLSYQLLPLKELRVPLRMVALSRYEYPVLEVSRDPKHLLDLHLRTAVLGDELVVLYGEEVGFLLPLRVEFKLVDPGVLRG